MKLYYFVAISLLISSSVKAGEKDSATVMNDIKQMLPMDQKGQIVYKGKTEDGLDCKVILRQWNLNNGMAFNVFLSAVEGRHADLTFGSESNSSKNVSINTIHSIAKDSHPEALYVETISSSKVTTLDLSRAGENAIAVRGQTRMGSNSGLIQTSAICTVSIK